MLIVRVLLVSIGITLMLTIILLVALVVSISMIDSTTMGTFTFADAFVLISLVVVIAVVDLALERLQAQALLGPWDGHVVRMRVQVSFLSLMTAGSSVLEVRSSTYSVGPVGMEMPLEPVLLLRTFELTLVLFAAA